MYIYIYIVGLLSRVSRIGHDHPWSYHHVCWWIHVFFYSLGKILESSIFCFIFCLNRISVFLMVIPSYTHHILVTIAAMEHHCWWEDHPHRRNIRAVRRTAISSLKHGIQDFSGWAIRVYRVIRCISLLKMNSEKKKVSFKENVYLVGGLEHFCFHILGIIIPTDFHIFQRGRYTTKQ